MMSPLIHSLKIWKLDSVHLHAVLTQKPEDVLLNITLIDYFTADHFNETSK